MHSEMTQPITPSSPPVQSSVFKARSVFAVVIGASLVGSLIGVAICLSAGWAQGRTLTSGATGAGVVWLVACVLGVQTLVIGTGLSVDRLGFGVLASSMARMLFALMLGLLAYFTVGFEGRSFWVCFLACGLTVLVAESLWAVRVINAAAASSALAGKHGGV